jgi:Spy/CpxP family protein refolding chaperone
MVSKKLSGMLVVATAGAMMVSMSAMAQAPGGGPPGGGGGPPRGGGMGGGGFAQPTDAAGVMQRFGLSSPDLKLTDAQKSAIEKAANAYLAETSKIPAAQGGPPSPEAQAARTAARTKFTGEVDKVLNADQKKIFDAAQQQRGGGMGGGGMGGGGMGGGRPGGGPGGPGGPPPGGA